MNKTAVSIPAELIPEFEAWGKYTSRLFGKLRRKAGMPALKLEVHQPDIPAEQAWFWTPQWQAMEREADEALARGDYETFDTVEDLIVNLHQHV
jgi:hypothetical protein